MFNHFPFYKYLLYGLDRKTNSINISPLSVVFVTTWKCNAKCKTCFIWRNHPPQIPELSLKEYQHILKSMDKTYWVTVGGGEPFLRKDFTDIVLNICRYLKPKIVNIPSNGSLPGIIQGAVRELVRFYPDTQFILNISLDHIGEEHDKIRGAQGSFGLVCNTVDKLRSLKRDNLSIGIHTVISKHNLADFPHIYQWINNNLKPDSYIIEDAQIREEFMNQDEVFFENPSDYLKAVKFYLEKIKSTRMSGIDRLRKAFRIVYYKSVRDSFLTGKAPYHCYAGYAACQINPDAEVWTCATKGYKMGNLRDYGYNFRKLWRCRQARLARRRIKDTKCSCHLSNASYTNMLLNPGKLASVLLNYIYYH